VLIKGGLGMTKEIQDYVDLRRKLATIKFAVACGNVSRACWTFNVPRASYYRWKKAYDEGGEAGLT
jgi:hypothetical protein